MSHLKTLLDQVIQGNDTAQDAFAAFCLGRQAPKENWQFMDTLKYFCQKATNNPDILLNNCYPEALVELAVFLQGAPGIFDTMQEVNDFMNLLKLAANKNNIGAQTALLILYKSNKKLLSVEEYYSCFNKAKCVLRVENPTRSQLLFMGILFNYYHQKAQLELNSPDPLGSAFKYFKSSAALDNPFAIVVMGFMYKEGQAGNELATPEERDTEAVKLFEKAAALGNDTAMYYLGLMYQEGRAGKGLATQEERDIEAVKLYKKSAALGNPVAMNKLGCMFTEGRAGMGLATQKERDIEAVKLYEKAVALGNPDAMNNLGRMYQRGRAGNGLATEAKRDVEAVKLYEKAVALGNALAMNNLAGMYTEGRAGKGLANDEERDKEAVKLYEKAAALGDTYAIFNLGWMCQEGRVGKGLATQEERDIEALKLYKKSAVLGNPNAMNNLGWMYENNLAGKLAEKDRLEKARDYYNAALTEFKSVQNKQKVKELTESLSRIATKLKQLQPPVNNLQPQVNLPLTSSIPAKLPGAAAAASAINARVAPTLVRSLQLPNSVAPQQQAAPLAISATKPAAAATATNRLLSSTNAAVSKEQTTLTAVVYQPVQAKPNPQPAPVVAPPIVGQAIRSSVSDSQIIELQQRALQLEAKVAQQAALLKEKEETIAALRETNRLMIQNNPSNSHAAFWSNGGQRRPASDMSGVDNELGDQSTAAAPPSRGRAVVSSGKKQRK